MRNFVFLMIVFIMIACSEKLLEYEHDGDLSGPVIEVNDNSIVIGKEEVDPEASYPGYEIQVDAETEFSGNAEGIDDVKKDQVAVVGYEESSKQVAELVEKNKAKKIEIK